MIDTTELLTTLSETPGPSGNEAAIASAVTDSWSPLVDEISTDRLGSVIAVKKGTRPRSDDAPRPRVLLAAHMDEIGLMVNHILDQNGHGFLRVTKVGGVDIRHLYTQPVVVHGKSDLPGVLGSLPASMLPDDQRSKPFDFDTLVVDTGLSHAELVEQVSLGDFVTFKQPLRKLLGSRVTGKAFDNRASVTAVSHCLAYLADRLHDWDVVAVATVQEETRLLGAYTTAFSQQPDLAVAIDVTFAKGALTTDTNTFALGSGPALDFGPNVHPGVYQRLKETASGLEMSVSTGTHSRASGTDAFGLQIAREGIPTGLVSIPLRYMHTMVEMIDTRDVERAGTLLGAFIAQLDADTLDKLAAGMMD